MALNHQISDAVNMRIDADPQGNPVLELEFKFLRYRIAIDDKEKGLKLFELLKLVLSTGGEEPDKRMPSFYKKK